MQKWWRQNPDIKKDSLEKILMRNKKPVISKMTGLKSDV